LTEQQAEGVMTDSIIENYNQLRQKVVEDDRRFQQKDGHLCFEGVISML
jgi:diaminopimelate decarboxylase